MELEEMTKEELIKRIMEAKELLDNAKKIIESNNIKIPERFKELEKE